MPMQVTQSRISCKQTSVARVANVREWWIGKSYSLSVVATVSTVMYTSATRIRKFMKTVALLVLLVFANITGNSQNILELGKLVGTSNSSYYTNNIKVQYGFGGLLDIRYYKYNYNIFSDSFRNNILFKDEINILLFKETKDYMGGYLLTDFNKGYMFFFDQEDIVVFKSIDSTLNIRSLKIVRKYSKNCAFDVLHFQRCGFKEPVYDAERGILYYKKYKFFIFKVKKKIPIYKLRTDKKTKYKGFIGDLYFPTIFPSQHDSIIIKQPYTYLPDSTGNKSGYMTEYLDKHLLVVDSEKKAAYFRYAYYENGRNLCLNLSNTGRFILVDSTLHQTEQFNIQLLHGTYVIKDKKGRVRLIHSYHKGNLLSIKAFDEKGLQNIDLDYTYKYQGQVGAYKLIEKSEDNICWCTIIKKVEGKWVREDIRIDCPDGW